MLFVEQPLALPGCAKNSPIRETLTLSASAESSTNTKKAHKNLGANISIFFISSTHIFLRGKKIKLNGCISYDCLKRLKFLT